MATKDEKLPETQQSWRLPSRIFSYVPILEPTRVFEFGQNLYSSTKSYAPTPLTGHIEFIETKLTEAYQVAEPKLKNAMKQAEPVLSPIGHRLDDFGCASLDRIEHGKEVIETAHHNVHDIVVDAVHDPVGTLLDASERTVDYLLPATAADEEQEAIEEVVGDDDHDVELKEVQDGAIPAADTATSDPIARATRLTKRVKGRASRRVQEHMEEARHQRDRVTEMGKESVTHVKGAIADPKGTMDKVLSMLLGEEPHKAVTTSISHASSVVIAPISTLYNMGKGSIESVYAAVLPYFDADSHTRFKGTVTSLHNAAHGAMTSLNNAAHDAYSAVVEQEKRKKFLNAYIMVYVRWSLDKTEKLSWTPRMIITFIHKARDMLPYNEYEDKNE